MGAHRVLVTGGCGYIGSHQVVALLDAGHAVHIVDDLSNSTVDVLDRIERICGRRPGFTPARVQDRDALADAFAEIDADAVIHFAAFKHVRESFEKPTAYFDNNVGGLLAVVTEAERAGVRRLVFSSSGSVYGTGGSPPFVETDQPMPTNPYSFSKLLGESVLRSLVETDPRWSVAALRYFNPAGAHSSGLLGDRQKGQPTNLVPVIMEVAAGRRDGVSVFGDDFDTSDGSGVRDYVHVDDVADAHLRALDLIGERSGFHLVNIGRGEGTSVLELIERARVVTGRPIPCTVEGRKAGDVAALWADASLAATTLGHRSARSLDQILCDAWRAAQHG